jgi:hypothetical protein
VHLNWDILRATLALEKGGPGYASPWTTLVGLCKVVGVHFKKGRKIEEGSKGYGHNVSATDGAAGDGVGQGGKFSLDLIEEH